MFDIHWRHMAFLNVFDLAWPSFGYLTFLKLGEVFDIIWLCLTSFKFVFSLSSYDLFDLVELFDHLDMRTFWYWGKFWHYLSVFDLIWRRFTFIGTIRYFWLFFTLLDFQMNIWPFWPWKILTFFTLSDFFWLCFTFFRTIWRFLHYLTLCYLQSLIWPFLPWMKFSTLFDLT
jgi:hypothetical protein